MRSTCDSDVRRRLWAARTRLSPSAGGSWGAEWGVIAEPRTTADDEAHVCSSSRQVQWVLYSSNAEACKHRPHPGVRMQPALG